LLLAISHELKSPLARSRVTLALLEESGYQQALLQDQVEMQGLIDGIISAERNQGDFALLQCEATDIKSLLGALLLNFTQAEKIDVKFPGGPVLANIDAGQIERLLRNLLGNALRYNRGEFGPVRLDAYIENQDLVLEVADHGPGIEAQHIERLTDAFYRVDTSRERGTGGLGLGLYLCQAVVDAHAGSLHIASEPGVGTKVTCRFPGANAG